jgi:hypothetical protein
MSLGDWKRRYTVRRFDRDVIPEDQHIEYIKEIFKYTPTQLGQVDHMWCVLGPKDQKLKDYLVKNYYYCNDEKRNHREYFAALADAPYLFTSFAIGLVHHKELNFELTPREKEMYREPNDNEVRRNNAFHAGILVTEALKLGYDTAQIACHEGWHADKREEYRSVMWERFGENLNQINLQFTNGKIRFMKGNISKCLMSVGIGKGLPNTPHNYEDYEDGVVFTGHKAKKWFTNIVD